MVTGASIADIANQSLCEDEIEIFGLTQALSTIVCDKLRMIRMSYTNLY